MQSGFRRTPVEIVREFAATTPGSGHALPVRLTDNDLPPEFGKFLSADLHVHMNYGGHYRNTPERLLAQQDAEDLDVVYNLIVNKEERIPDIAYFKPGGIADAASGKRLALPRAGVPHEFLGSHGLLNLEDHYLLPDFTAYRHTAFESPWPHNGAIADLAHAQGALVGYVHIADFPIDPPKEKKLSYELPATVAHGKVDYLEVMGFSDHHVTAGIWYRLLNLGFRLPAGAGTDAMANYASLRGPIGLVRVFLGHGGERTPKALRDALKSGRTFVTNGPPARADGRRPAPGRRAARAAGQAAGPRRAALAGPDRSPRAGAERARGQVVHARPASARASTGSGDIDFDAGGWVCCAPSTTRRIPGCSTSIPTRRRARCTFESPARRPPPEDAAYFVAWMDRVDRSRDCPRRLEQRAGKVRHARLSRSGAREIPRARRALKEQDRP